MAQAQMNMAQQIPVQMQAMQMQAMQMQRMQAMQMMMGGNAAAGATVAPPHGSLHAGVSMTAQASANPVMAAAMQGLNPAQQRQLVEQQHMARSTSFPIATVSQFAN